MIAVSTAVAYDEHVVGRYVVSRDAQMRRRVVCAADAADGLGLPAQLRDGDFEAASAATVPFPCLYNSYPVPPNCSATTSPNVRRRVGACPGAPATPLDEASPSSRRLNPSKPSLSPVTFFSPSIQPGILQFAPGSVSFLYAYPIAHPTAAASAEPGSCERES